MPSPRSLYGLPLGSRINSIRLLIGETNILILAMTIERCPLCWRRSTKQLERLEKRK